MAKNSQAHKNTVTKNTSDISALAMVDIRFEYDRTWDEARKSVQARPTKSVRK